MFRYEQSDSIRLTSGPQDSTQIVKITIEPKTQTLYKVFPAPTFENIPCVHFTMECQFDCVTTKLFQVSKDVIVFKITNDSAESAKFNLHITMLQRGVKYAGE